ncbi:hypothetical protein [Streptomyces afghaniensis]|uniref:hypothetical protein n=1 Tax=Streptomyces afghaniensis TaxID=66865 RepID=UPI0037975D2A
MEPIRVMLAKRPPGAAPGVQGVAERLPLRDDAAMALLTVHHERPKAPAAPGPLHFGCGRKWADTD